MRAPSASTKRLRRLTAGALILTATVLLGGCVKITGSTASQSDTLGPINTEHQVCFALDGSGTCPSPSSTGLAAGKAQLLFAFRVPDWAPAPTGVTFLGTGSSAGTTLTFSASSTYATELQALFPRAGTKWFGFVSQPNPAISSGVTATGKIGATWAIPDAQSAPFTVFAMAGFRAVDGAATPTRDVRCSSAAFGSSGFDMNDSVCSTGWWPNDGAADADPANNTFEVLLRNRLVLTGPPAATVTAGGSATLSFSTSGAVAFLNANVPVAASTTAPGASIAAPTQTPIAGTRDIPVTVDVPASAPAGGFSVRLAVGTGLGAKVVDVPLQIVAPVASGGGSGTSGAGGMAATPTPTTPVVPGTTPTGTGGAPADLSTFAGSAAAAGLQVGSAAGREALRTGRLRIKVRASRRGYLEATLKSGRTLLAKGQVAAKRKGLVTVKLKLRPAGRAALRDSAAIDGTLKVRFKPRGRTATSTSVAVRLPATS